MENPTDESLVSKLALPLEKREDRNASAIRGLAEASRQRPPGQPTQASETEELKLQRKSSIGSWAGSTGSSPAAQAAPGKARVLFQKSGTLDSVKPAKPSMSQRWTEFEANRQEDLKVGEAWNQELQNAAHRNNPEVCQRFWAEMKARVMRRYGSIGFAFKESDTSRDGVISFLEFVDMLRVIRLPLDIRIARAMFEKASGGDRELSLEELKGLLMEKTILKLKHALRGFSIKQASIRKQVHHFLHCLSDSNPEIMIRSADRLQKKLTVPFLREFWHKLRDHAAKSHADGELKRSEFMQVVDKEVGIRLVPVEMTFLMRIFDRVDEHATGHVHLRTMLTALVLVSDEPLVENKMGLLFDVFDTDSDGCLLYDQILDLVRTICAHRHIVEDVQGVASPTAKKDSIEFREELTSQDGLRLYECLLWYLERTTKLDSDIVTWNELWHAFEQRPEILNAVMPGLFRIQWVLQPSVVEEQEEASTSEPRHHQPAPATDPPPKRSSIYSNASRGGMRERLADLSSHPVANDVRTGSKSNAWEQSSRRSTKQTAWAAQRENRDTTASFQRVVTNRFLASLRNFGDLRYAELKEGFKSVELDAAKSDSLSVEDAEAPSPTAGAMSPQHTTTNSPTDNLDEMRPSSAAGLQRSSPEMSRPGSSPALKARPGSSPAAKSASSPASSTGKGSRTMQRVSSAPTGLSEKSRPSGHGNGGSPSGLAKAVPLTPERPKSKQSTRLPNSADLPIIDSQRWGLEAADRFRLFSTVRNSRDTRRHLKGSCGHTELVGYKCQLCRFQHTMLTSF